MRIGLAAVLTAVGLAVSGCGSQPGAAPTGGSPSAPDKAVTSSPRATPWSRIVDPSGITFTFPSGTKPTLSASANGTTRTYIANAGGAAVASVVIVPTQLNVENFVRQYPIKLKAEGNSRIKAGTISPITVQGFKGFRNDLHYDSPPGPSHVYETRAAIQLPKYLVVISSFALDNKALTAAEIAQAKATNVRLIAGFRARRP